ncbi:MAG: STAS domain-containing protein [Deltaproteobacteria bacterium]|nr:STAS domain-containing protein [Deltaproteobacteria bacterium]
MVDQPQPITQHSLMQEMALTDQEITRRKEFLEFRDEDAERLRSLHELARRYADVVIEDFYRHLLAFEESRVFFQDPAVLERVKLAQKQYFLRLTQGDYDAAYAEDRLKVGMAHERINLPLKLYLGSYSFYLQAVAPRILEAHQHDPEQVLPTFLSFLKLVLLDMSLAIETYLHQRERTIHAQQEAIRELSTPVLQLRERLLLLPIIGAIDSRRAQQLTEQLLHSIRAHRAKVVVMDITGVPAVDSAVANHLIQTVQASRLMGATVIVTGLSAEVAQTLVRIGVDLSMVQTVGDLQGGIEEADRLLGYTVIRAGETTAQNQSTKGG